MISKHRKVLMHGVGLSHATVGGYAVLKREYGGPPWYREVNGIWWTTKSHVYFWTFRRHSPWASRTK